MNKYLFMIDTNGILFYYPDSIAITSLESWLESLGLKLKKKGGPAPERLSGKKPLIFCNN
jgi:hypothetical protein